MHLNRTSYSSTIAVPVDLLGAPWVGEEGGDLASHYYRARYYDPKAGRFISEDPIGFGGGDVNLYAYVFGAPTNWFDAFGLKANINLFTAFDAATVDGKFYDPYAAGELYENPDGAYTVVGHGERSRIGTLDPNGLSLNPLELAARILRDPDFHGQPIIILACNTSTGTDADPSFAERVLHEIVFLRRRSQTVVGYVQTLINQDASPTIKGMGETRFRVRVPGAP